MTGAGLGWNECPFRAHLREKGLLDKYQHDYETNRYPNRKQVKDYTDPPPLSEEDCHDAFIAKLFADWVAAYQDTKPFLAWVDFVAPHLPCDAPEPYSSMYAPTKMRDPIPPTGEGFPAAIRTRAEKQTGTLTPEQLRKVRAGYYGMISLLDAQVGKMVAALGKRGVLDNTVVVFVGDQGCQIGDHGQSPLLVPWLRYGKSR